MAKLNEAQKLREALGIEVAPFGANELRASATKKGPGRRHEQGLKRDAAPKRSAGIGFVQHEASADKRERRALVKKLGRRQALKAIKAERREVAQ